MYGFAYISTHNFLSIERKSHIFIIEFKVNVFLYV